MSILFIDVPTLQVIFTNIPILQMKTLRFCPLNAQLYALSS